MQFGDWEVGCWRDWIGLDWIGFDSPNRERCVMFGLMRVGVGVGGKSQRFTTTMKKN